MNETTIDDVAARLKRANLRPTVKRLAILNAMTVAGKPMSATEIAAIAGEGTTVVSVYQAMHRLIKGGVVARLNDGQLMARYIRLP